MDYDSARHHYESLQTAKKKDEAKIAKVGKGWDRVRESERLVQGSQLWVGMALSPLPDS